VTHDPPVSNEPGTVRLQPMRSLGVVAPEPAPLEHTDALPEGTSIGRYRLLSLLGEGGMGMVYEAWDPQLARRVALKLLHPNRVLEDAPAPDERLLAEARALAKIEHPNIVSVYDAGMTSYGVFIAMELCRGQSLRSWMAERERSVREVLDAYIAAGRGLAAAHRAGIVHRDFKPTNVLVGEDGWVKVADFGLAHPIDVKAELDDASATMSITDCDRSASTIVGTPAYMSPEQLVGRNGDHRMDQFSFCVCLYHALVGHPPFPDGTLHERRGLVLSGLGGLERHRLALAPHVPARVRRAIRRGLAVEPSLRFDSMELLLAELVERKRWPWALSSSTLVVGLGLGVLAMTEPRPGPCDHADELLSATWGPERREALALSIERTGHPDAAARVERVMAVFDHRARAWQDAHAMACSATHEATQSEATFELRMRCLERQRTRLDIAVDVMMQAEDPAELDARMTVPFRLPAIDECSDVEALASELPRPEGPTHARVTALEQHIDRADALREGGALREGLALAARAVAEARTLDHPPVLAQALECLGRLQADGDSPQVAEQTLREAIEVGVRGHDDRVVARAWPSLLYVLVLQDRLLAGETLAFAAEAAVTRAGDEQARGWLLNNLGILHSERGDHERARDHLQRALEVKLRLYGPHHLDVGITWSNLGFALADGERWEEAAAAFDRAQAILAATVGDTHPIFEVTRMGLCHVAGGRKQHELALELCTRALRGLEATTTSPVLESRGRVITAKALHSLGRPQEALHMAKQARAQVDGVDPRRVAEIDAWMAEIRRETDEQ